MRKRIVAIILALVSMLALCAVFCGCDPYPRKAEIVINPEKYGGVRRDSGNRERWYFQYTGEPVYFDICRMYKDVNVDPENSSLGWIYFENDGIQTDFPAAKGRYSVEIVYNAVYNEDKTELLYNWVKKTFELIIE